MEAAWKEGTIQTGIYNKVHVGLTITEAGPCWSVDVETNVDGITIVGGGATLAEAAEDAAQHVLNMVDDAQS